MKNAALLSFVVALATLPREAVATPSAPAKLRDHLGMACAVECTTCHESNLASRGNATRPLALALAEELSRLDLDITSDGALERALDALEESGSDSDGDQVADVEELLAEPPSDPSSTAEGTVCAADVRYGCGAEFTGRPSRGPGLFAALVALGLALRRRRSLTRA